MAAAHGDHCDLHLSILRHARIDAAVFAMVGLAPLFGVLLVILIGAADMPVVMSLLNS
jgi:NAD/NADP transhydrogenase beta subunit